MHTIVVITLGFIVLVGCTLAARLLGGASAVSTAALAFLPIWCCGAALNMYLGVKKAGYTIAQEAPMFLLVFGIPALAAAGVWWLAR